MKKSVIAASIALAMGATGADAAFTGFTDGNYTLTITSGCFEFGSCTINGDGTGFGEFHDSVTPTAPGSPNYAAVLDTTTVGYLGTPPAGLPAGVYGSGIANDGVMGVINFDFAGGAITSVNSFAQDTYLTQAGGNFWLSALGGTGSMGGTIDSTGYMEFDTTGRTGVALNFASTLGNLPWNVDNATGLPGSPAVTGLQTLWTTGTQTAWKKTALGTPIVSTGSNLVDAGTGTWTGTLVGTGNIGSAWGSSFNGTQYTEIFNIKITANTPAVPVPAAVWLFGSGLVGLVGVARRRKNAV